MPDAHAVRGYLSERDRHRKAALKALAGIAASTARVLRRAEGLGGRLDTSEVRRIAGLALEASTQAEALDAVDQLSFLISGPEF